MTDLEIKALMDSTGLYYDPVHPDYIEEQKLEELPLPFMEWELGEDAYFADGIRYATWPILIIRVFTDTATKSADSAVGRTLTGAGLAYQSSERVFLPDLAIWQTTFTLEV